MPDFEVRFSGNKRMAVVVVRKLTVLEWSSFHQKVKEIPDVGAKVALVDLRELGPEGLDASGITALQGLMRRIRTQGCRSWAFGARPELEQMLARMQVLDFMTSRT